VVGSITGGYSLNHTINKWSKLEPLTTVGSQAVYDSHTKLSDTIFHKNIAESSHMLSILGCYRSCIQSAQSMLSIA